MEVILLLMLGIVVGVVCGLVSGLHPNTTLPIILASAAVFGEWNTAILILTIGIVNTFVAFIPSVYFCAPEESTALSILPGHRLLLKGQGYLAVKHAVIGGLVGFLIMLAALPLLFFIFPGIYFTARPFIHFILLLAVFFMIWREAKPFHALAIFLVSGIVGYFTLGFDDSLILALLSGFFAFPTIFVSLRNSERIVSQETDEHRMTDKKKTIKSSIIGNIAGMIAGLLPGFGITQSIVLTQSIFRKIDPAEGDEKDFLVSLGAANVSDIFYSIIAILLISNPRSGIAIAIQKLITINAATLQSILIISFFLCILSAALTLLLAKSLAKILEKINYKAISVSVLLLLAGIILYFNGVVGIFVASLCALIGIFAIKFNVNRTNCLGCLILPTILWFALH